MVTLTVYGFVVIFLIVGASIMTVGAFITTLTMVGFVTIPLEIEQLGRKFTLLRNGFSLVFAIIIATGMEVLL